MATPTEMAREATLRIAQLRAEFDIREKELGKLELLQPRVRVAVLEEKLAKAERDLESLKLLPVLDDKVGKLEKHIDDTEKRRWQFVYVFTGAVATLLVTVVVQLVLLPLVKK